MQRSRSRLVLRSYIFIAASLLAGCVSVPDGFPRKIDRDSPEFKAAVARESAVLQAAGKSADKSEKLAVGSVIRTTIAAEDDRRSQLFVPLLQAVTALQQARTGCWSYTVTTTTQKAGTTAVLVEHFDPSEPEERVWTLVTRDGRAPDDREQTEYRKDRLRAWKRERNAAQPRTTKLKNLEMKARVSEFNVVGAGAGAATYSFEYPAMAITGLGSGPRTRETYRLDATGQVAQHTETNFGPTTMLGGSIQFLIWDMATDYTVIDPAQPPFITRNFAHYQAKLFGIDSGEIVREQVFADIRPVKCYDDRFQVEIGELIMKGFIP